MENLIKTGARKGNPTAFRKWISKIAAPVLVVFPAPGESFFRSHGIYLNDYFDVAANPRDANVLLVGGAVSEKLAQKIAVVYLQMPRPRALVFAGAENIPILPEPDLNVDLNEEEIRNLKTKLTEKFQNAYRNDAEVFEPDFTKEMMEEDKDGGGHEHHHGHDHGGDGQEKEGDHHDEHEHQDEDHKHHKGGHENHAGSHEHNGEEHEHHENAHGDHEEHKQHEHHHEHHTGKHEEHSDDEEGGHDHGEHSVHDHGDQEHEGHGGHDHGGMGFMSMVAMTKDMPRATDGLAMERNNVWFGPFFPGLPGGLAFQFTTDGDTVVEVQAEKELFENTVSIPANLTPEKLLQEMAVLNPLLPNTYRILGEQLLKRSAGKTHELTPQQVIFIEKERILSHLNWLTTFSVLVGNQWMEKEAGRQMRSFQNNSGSANLKKITSELQGFKLLKNKLKSAGEIPENLLHHTSGPTARAAGKTVDARSTDETYKKAGFEITRLNENNAWGRLQLRLLEIEQSLEILKKLENETAKSQPDRNFFFAEPASVHLEGPAGIIEAELQTENGRFKCVTITEASAIQTVLAEQLVKEMELSDALVTIASLDINPFTVNGKCIKHQND